MSGCCQYEENQSDRKKPAEGRLEHNVPTGTVAVPEYTAGIQLPISGRKPGRGGQAQDDGN